MPDGIEIALCINALGPRLTGIGRYCLELARRVPAADGIADVRFFRGPHWLPDPAAALAENWRPDGLHRWRWRRKLAALQQRKFCRRAVAHGPNFFIPEWAERGVVTVHDLSVFLYPETHPPERIRAFERDFLRSVDQAAAIVTDSETIRQELLSLYAVPAEKVTAIPLGVDPAVLAPELAAAELAALGLEPGGYTLCISTFEPRKRIDCLLAAYARLDPAIRQRVPLVLAGASGWRNDTLLAAIAEAESQGWVRKLNYVDNRTLQALYSGARLFAYPSAYEGFGLPPIEAMAHGVPTVVSDTACLAETTRGAARLVDTADELAFADALADALADDVWRAEARAQGRKVVAGYDWDSCVARTINVYQKVAAA